MWKWAVATWWWGRRRGNWRGNGGGGSGGRFGAGLRKKTDTVKRYKDIKRRQQRKIGEFERFFSGKK